MIEPGLNGERCLIVRTNSIDGSNVLIEVRDSGIGIAPEELESILDPFITSKRDGLGMGLSICRSIIEHHGGKHGLRTIPTAARRSRSRFRSSRTARARIEGPAKIRWTKVH